MARTINSPGFELHEIDRSQYNRKINNSLQKAPVCLMLGYADKGEDYIPQWINIKNTFIDIYGTPKSEKERYLYNAAMEVVNNGGICITSKLPYQNEQKQNYAYTTYEVALEDVLPAVKQLDKSLTTAMKISNKPLVSNASFNDSELMSSDDLESYLSKSRLPDLNTIRIVDISHDKYTSTYQDTVKTNIQGSYYKYTNDCLGIVPVIVSPTNALYFQNVLSVANIDAEDYQVIEGFSPCYSRKHIIENSAVDSKDISVDFTALNKAENYYVQFKTDDKSIHTVSKQAADTFPTLTWKAANQLDRKYLKSIGVVVLQAFNDEANNNKISFKMLESFVGTIDFNESRTTPNAQFIDDVVNQNSNYIRVFSNLSQADVDSCQIAYANNQRSTSLGFYQTQCNKTFKLSSKEQTLNVLLADVNRALSKLNNTMTQQIDIVLDAGMSNIVQEVYSTFDGSSWKLDAADDTTAWQKTQTIFDNFCKQTRKDCMFIADGIRTLCLNNEQKIVNSLMSRTVENTIIPKFKLFNRLDSSYSTGYCNWFLVTDDIYPNTYFWIPPSAKAVKAYINCDTYFHTWDAPAGIIRARMDNVIDIAFNPSQKEADYIYLNGWNYALSYPLEGVVLEGQKTFQNEATALDRVNVRRLMLWLERSVVSVAKYFLYEHNTQYNRQRFVDTITPIFEQAKTGYGISDYAIKCDDDLNTPDTVDRNELHMKIAVKPIKTIEFICISFILTNQYTSVQEEILK